MIALKEKTTPASALRDNVFDKRGRFLRDLRLSVIDACNLRCQYCLPADIFGDDFRFTPLKELLSFDDLTTLAEAFVDLGVDKIRLTGGEPLLRPKLPELVTQLRALDDSLDLALTTNGLKLGQLAHALKQAGLNRVNISLDALDNAVAAAMSGRSFSPQSILENAELAREAGLGVKLNCVVKRSVNFSEILPLAKASRERGFPLRFIEYMDVGNSNGWDRKEVVTAAEIREVLSSLGELEALPPQGPGEVARGYRYADGGGDVGFINSITEPFCGGCTRARVSASGVLYSCLFASKGLSLKDALHDKASLRERICGAWQKRDDRYSELRGQTTTPTRHEEMWRLGG